MKDTVRKAYNDLLNTLGWSPNKHNPRRRATVADYKALAKAHGFKWTGKKLPRTVRTVTSWQCLAQGHCWHTRYNNIRQGSGCPYCSRHPRKTRADYCTLAKQQGYEWKGKNLPRTTSTNTSWQCLENGHYSKTSYEKIRRRKFCPDCLAGYREQEKTKKKRSGSVKCCAHCGNVKRVRYLDPKDHNQHICTTCWEKATLTDVCPICHETTVVLYRYRHDEDLTKRICRRCYRKQPRKQKAPIAIG